MSVTPNVVQVVAQMVDELLEGAVVEWVGSEAHVTWNGKPICWAGPDPDRPPREIVAFVVDMVQDMAVETPWGRAVPECPGHPHPAVLRVTDEGVAWVCPQTKQVLRTYAVDG